MIPVVWARSVEPSVQATSPSRAGAERPLWRRGSEPASVTPGCSRGITQQEAADAAGISQTRCSELERGLGANASLVTWAVAAAAVGEQLVGFLERAPGAAPPRDIEHLRRQAA